MEDPPTLWELATGKHIRNLEGKRMRWHSRRFAFSPDGKTVAAGVDGTILLWDVFSGKQIRKVKGHHGGIHSLELIGTTEAQSLVEDLGRGFAAARQTQEARLTLERMKKRGK